MRNIRCEPTPHLAVVAELVKAEDTLLNALDELELLRGEKSGAIVGLENQVQGIQGFRPRCVAQVRAGGADAAGHHGSPEVETSLVAKLLLGLDIGSVVPSIWG